MVSLDFKAFREAVFRLYNQGAFREALALMDEQAGRFPQEGCDLYYWRACLACRVGDPAAGLAWLQEASDRGDWYHESVLQDPDLAPLSESDQFAAVRAAFQERYAVAQAKAQPLLKAWSPAGEARGLLLALHGAGGNIESEEESDHWRPAVALGWRVALAQSSQVWAPGKYFWRDREVGITEVGGHVAALQAPETTVLAGFSQGAGLAMHAVLGGTLAVDRFLAVAPAIRPEALLPLLAACRREVRGYIVIGEQDRYCPAAVAVANAMKQAGLACELELHPGLGHDFPAGFPTALERRLAHLTR